MSVKVLFKSQPSAPPSRSTTYFTTHKMLKMFNNWAIFGINVLNKLTIYCQYLSMCLAGRLAGLWLVGITRFINCIAASGQTAFCKRRISHHITQKIFAFASLTPSSLICYGMVWLVWSVYVFFFFP